MMDLHCDFEWFSDVDIRRGPEQYFGACRQGPLMMSYAFTGGDIRRWLPGEPRPQDILEHAATGGVFVAHNAGGFERHAWRVMVARYGWPDIPIAQWRDTMAQACAMGLPADLDNLALVLGVTQQKDKAGKALIKHFCIPQADGEFNDPYLPTNHDRFEQFRGYCDQDVRAEMDVDRRLVPLCQSEQRAWVLDQQINDRGIRVDRASAIASLGLIARATEQMDARMVRVTGGAVTACSQASRLTNWVEAQGVTLEGVAKDDVLEALDLEDLPANVREALEIRQAAAKTSTAKIAKLLAFSEGSGRIKNRMRFHGTGPGRWSCLDPNLFNLPRPRKVYADAVEDGHLDVNQAFEFIRAGDPDLLEAMYGSELGRPLDFLSDSIRGFLVAAPGHDLIAVDYSSIQGVLCAWFAGEEWKLQAIQEILDDPKKPDLYRRAAAGILNTTTDIVTKKHWARQIGKVSELALGFAGGVPALVSMSRNYALRKRQLHDLYPGVWLAASEESRAYAVKRHEHVSRSRNRMQSDVLTREAWIACALIVRGWRATNPAIKQAWTTLETAIRNAVRAPGEIVTTLRGVQYLVKGGSLWCRLPSGRCIHYSSPRLKDQVWVRMRPEGPTASIKKTQTGVEITYLGDWGEAEVMDKDEAERLARQGLAKIEGETSPKVTVLGWSNTIRKMERYALYGGLCMENLCLGAESCILRVGLRECEENGYPPVLHNYDEIIAEVPVGTGSIEEMAGLMLRLPEWAKDLPLGAAGWRGKRNRK